jgi:DNA-binding MarR family transcriptional regulator
MKHTDLQANHRMFFRFLKLTQEVNRKLLDSELTPRENHLLQEVVLCYFENRALTVKQALALDELGSPATLHKRIKHLRHVGLLSVRQKETDHRTKYLIATPLAIQHFERMGKVMKQAVEG